ncbi:MAG TPA: hypothetical protein VJ846_05465 [Sphingomicrobium sp.]|nr:hypothetical protein [Sphingomicrobium sp.]
MRAISPAKTAFAVGAVVCIYHLIWVALVALGWAKPVMDFVLRLHFIRLQYDIAPFLFSTAAMLLALTFCFGAFFGFVFALVWNWLAAAKAQVTPAQAPASPRTSA